MADQPKKSRRVKTVMFSITDGLVHHVHCPKGVRVVIKSYESRGLMNRLKPTGWNVVRSSFGTERTIQRSSMT